MNITKESAGSQTALLKIEIAQADYAAEVEKQLREIRKKANMPGFRPGQVPMGMIKKMYQKSTVAETIEKLMSNEMASFLEKNNIKPLGYPMPNDDKTKVDWDNDTDFTFYFDLAEQPEVNVDIASHKTTYYAINPSEEDVNKLIEDIQKRFGKFSSPEKIEDKDLVYGKTIELNEDGTEKEGGINAQTSLAVDRIAQKTIQKKFIGKTKDAEITFNVAKAFPNATDRKAMLHLTDEQAKDFASEIKFVVSSISRIEPHELNEELFAEAYKGEDIKTEEAFRQRAMKDLKDNEEKETDKYFVNQVSQELLKKTDIKLPDDFMKRWLISNSQGELTKDQLDKDYNIYADSIRWQMIEGTISDKYNLKIDREEIKNYIKNYIVASYFPMQADENEDAAKKREETIENIAENMLKNQEQTKNIYEYLFDEKLAKALKENMKVTRKELSFDEFKKMMKKESKPSSKTNKKEE